MSNYANRGVPFEEFLSYVNQRYTNHHIASIVKVPTKFIPIRDRYGKVCSCKVEDKSCVDYIGHYKAIPVAVEAKHTESDTIRFDAVQPHQKEFMDQFTAMPGTTGMVAVSFQLRRFFVVPWPFWDAAREMWEKAPRKKKTITYNGQTWTTPGKASVRMEELLPEWEIKQGGPFGLDYLKHTETYKNIQKR